MNFLWRSGVGREDKSGFTLVELMMSIALIAIFFTIVYASLNNARTSSRDSRRLADLKQIQSALALYISTCGQYPRTLDLGEGIGCPTGTSLGSYIKTIPTDPVVSIGNYIYSAQVAGGATGSQCLSYRLHTTLETENHSALQNDLDGPALPPSGTCSGSANDISGDDPVYEVGP